MGMAYYVAESFHHLLVGDSESISDSDSSRGSHHLSRECFMTGAPEGRVESVHEGGVTPPNDFNDEVKEDAGALPHMQVEQLRARHQELEDASLQLEQERAELECEIERRGDGGRARAIAHDVNWRIVEDDRGLPRFA